MQLGDINLMQQW